MAVSAIDMAEKPAATKSWWCLFKALSEMGHEIIVLPFLGKAIESPWWHSLDNPSRVMSSLLYSQWRGRSKSSRTKRLYTKYHRAFTYLPGFVISRKWKAALDKAMAREDRVDAAIFLSVPLNLLAKVPRYLQERWGVPSIYYEADMPSILPSYGGIHFTYYLGADLSQFSGFLSDSDGVEAAVRAMGARNVGSLHWAADPVIFSPRPLTKDTDVFFTGGTSAFRRDWIYKMLAEPAGELLTKTFAMSGRMRESYENVKSLGFLSFDTWKRQVCRSRICLNISRTPHASIGGTSSTRIFELASMGACIVSSPHKGLEKWFEPSKEIIILRDDERPSEVYSKLLGSPSTMEELGSRARNRVLAEHTYYHRAKELLGYLNRVVS